MHSTRDTTQLTVALLEGGPGARRRRPTVLVAVVSSAAVLGLCALSALRRYSGSAGDEAGGSSSGGEPGDEAVGLESTVLAELRALLDERTDLLMPVIELPRARMPTISAVAASSGGSDFSTLTPVVFLHGEGDKGDNPGMQSLCKTASDAYPGLYVVCASVASGIASITTPLAEQVEEFAQYVNSDARLAMGFHGVGLSQGGLVLRGYVETRNTPPVRRLISLCTPHGGSSACPSNALYKMVCPLWRLAPYTARLAFADYWKDAGDQSTYLDRSRWLADINNERHSKKATYRSNMRSLERYVLVEATNDTTVAPHASESHGFYEWGGSGAIVPLRQSDGYKGDYIGLRNLDEAGRLHTLTYEGDHLAFSPRWWSEVVIPHLGP